jgi:tetratricopeptide (TPR) repeat protein
MTTATMIDSLERTSRNSAILMALGAFVVAAALWVATSRLRSVQAEVAALDAQGEIVSARNHDLERTNAELANNTATLRNEVAGLRQALSASRNAIAAFHAGDYATAVSLYDSALASDPGNAYLMNLKAYSLFKLGRVADAVKLQQEGIRVDPTYAWGFFDLARFQCASGDRTAAAKSLTDAASRDERFRQIAKQDGEFRRLCGSMAQ